MGSTRKRINLTLEKLRSEHPGITECFGGVLAETCAICLVGQNHSSGVELSASGYSVKEYSVLWSFSISDEMQRCYQDADVTTEHGAYALAILILHDLTGLKVVERSRKGNGFDYYLGEKKEGLFQSKARLEVSGIRKGTDYIVSRRSNEKIQRLKQYRSSLPAYIAVIEFQRPVCKVDKYVEN